MNESVAAGTAPADINIGVLALQGAFREHIQVLKALGVAAVEVRKPEQLAGLHGVIIPGGESTTIGKLATTFDLVEPLRALCRSGKPVWGTCAGMIFMARAAGHDQALLGALDVKVERNAYGRQTESFEAELDIAVLSPRAPFRGIFIRAPRIAEAGPGVDILARLGDGTIVAVRQGNLFATSFHPELTGDSRFHRYFLSACSRR